MFEVREAKLTSFCADFDCIPGNRMSGDRTKKDHQRMGNSVLIHRKDGVSGYETSLTCIASN